MVGWSNTSGCVLSSVSIAADSATSDCGSGLCIKVVRRVHQHADLGLKIRRTPIQNIMLLLLVDASLNIGGLVGSQGGYMCGVTDKSLLERKDAPSSPMAWRSFKMS